MEKSNYFKTHDQNVIMINWLSNSLPAGSLRISMTAWNNSDVGMGIPEWDQLRAIRLRLSSHRLPIETGRWSRIPRDQRFCSCGMVQTEVHLICLCPIWCCIIYKY